MLYSILSGLNGCGNRLNDSVNGQNGRNWELLIRTSALRLDRVWML